MISILFVDFSSKDYSYFLASGVQNSDTILLLVHLYIQHRLQWYMWYIDIHMCILTNMWRYGGRDKIYEVLFTCNRIVQGMLLLVLLVWNYHYNIYITHINQLAIQLILNIYCKIIYIYISETYQQTKSQCKYHYQNTSEIVLCRLFAKK